MNKFIQSLWDWNSQAIKIESFKKRSELLGYLYEVVRVIYLIGGFVLTILIVVNTILMIHQFGSLWILVFILLCLIFLFAGMWMLIEFSISTRSQQSWIVRSTTIQKLNRHFYPDLDYDHQDDKLIHVIFPILLMACLMMFMYFQVAGQLQICQHLFAGTLLN